MKKFIVFLFILSASLHAECEIKFQYKTSPTGPKPLWNDDEHSQYYRCLYIIDSIYRLEKHVQSIPIETELYNKINYEINLMKLNVLGELTHPLL